MNNSSLTGLTGLEPATSAVTGRCSNQLNYSPLIGAIPIMQTIAEFVNSYLKIGKKEVVTIAQTSDR
jgi:hypothetical protein